MEKVFLPIKTKIAAWWMIIFGVINIIMSFLGIVPSGRGDPANIFFREIILWAMIISIILSGCFLIRRKKWALVISIGVLILMWIITAADFHKEYVDSYGYCEPQCRYDIHPLNSGIEYKINDECLSKCRSQITFFISLFLFPSFLIPLILLLLDRKNFWKVAK